MLVPLFFYTLIIILLWWCITFLYKQYKANHNSNQQQPKNSITTKTDNQRRKINKKPDKNNEGISGSNRHHQKQFYSKGILPNHNNDTNNIRNNEKVTLQWETNATGYLPIKNKISEQETLNNNNNQRQGEQQQNKLELKISSNQSEHNDADSNQQLSEIVRQKMDQKNLSYYGFEDMAMQDDQKNNDSSNSNYSNNSNYRNLQFSSNYHNNLTIVNQVSQQHRPSSRNYSIPSIAQSHSILQKQQMYSSIQPHSQNINHYYNEERLSQPLSLQHRNNQQIYVFEENSQKYKDDILNNQSNKNKKNSQKPQFSQIQQTGNNHEMDPQISVPESLANNKELNTLDKNNEQNNQISIIVVQGEEIYNSRNTQKQQNTGNYIQKTNGQDLPKKLLKIQSQQQKHLSNPNKSQQEQQIPKSIHHDQNKPEQNSNSFSKQEISERVQSKIPSNNSSDIPMIIVRQTLRVALDVGEIKASNNNQNIITRVYKKNIEDPELPHTKQLPNNLNLSLDHTNKNLISKESKAISQHSSQHSQASNSHTVQKRDLTKLLEQIDSFFMNNSNGSPKQSLQKQKPDQFIDSSQHLPTSNYQISSGDFINEKSFPKSEINRQNSLKLDNINNKKEVEIVNAQESNLPNINAHSIKGQSYLNLSSRKDSNQNKISHPSSDTNNINLLPKPPNKKKIKKKKKVSKTQKFKLKQHLGQDEEYQESASGISQSDYYNDQEQSYKEVQEDIISQLQIKIKKLMSAVANNQNKYDTMTKQINTQKEVRDGLLNRCKQLEQLLINKNEENKRLLEKLQHTKQVKKQQLSKVNEKVQDDIDGQTPSGMLLSQQLFSQDSSPLIKKGSQQKDNSGLQARPKQISESNEQQEYQQLQYSNQPIPSMYIELINKKQRIISELQRQQTQRQEEYLQQKEQLEKLQKNQLRQKNKHDELIQAYDEKIKAQGEVIEQSLRKIRELEGISSDCSYEQEQYEDRNSMYYSSNKEGTGSFQRTNAKPKKTLKNPKRQSSYVAHNSSHLQIAQQINKLQEQYNRTRQQANQYKQKCKQLQKIIQQLKNNHPNHKITSDANDQQNNNKNNNNISNQQYQSIHLNPLSSNKNSSNQQQHFISQECQTEKIFSTNNNQINQQYYSNKIQELYKQFQVNNNNMSAQLEFCQEQIKNMLGNQRILNLEIEKLRGIVFERNYDNMVNVYGNAKLYKNDNINNDNNTNKNNTYDQSHRELYEEIRDKYHKLKNKRHQAHHQLLQSIQRDRGYPLESSKANFYHHKHPHHIYHSHKLYQLHPSEYSPPHYNNRDAHGRERQPDNEQGQLYIKKIRRKHLLKTPLKYPKAQSQEYVSENPSYMTSPKSQKTLAKRKFEAEIMSKRSLNDYNQNQWKEKSKFYQLQINSPNQLLLSQSLFIHEKAKQFQPYINFMKKSLNQNNIYKHNAKKIYSSKDNIIINKSALKLAINNIENILFIFKIKQSQQNKNDGKIMGAFTRLPLIADTNKNQSKRFASQQIGDYDKKIALGLLFDFQNFLVYKSNPYATKKSIASYDDQIIVWGYNELFIDVKFPKMLYVNYNHQGTHNEQQNNIYWRSVQQVQSFINFNTHNNVNSNRQALWVEIQGFQIFALTQ